MEKETRTHYVTIRGLRKRANYSQREFICHRSYIGKSILTNRKRALKSIGSNKLSTTCPSRMVVIITDIKVTVSFVGMHIGHCNEIIRLPPSKRGTSSGKPHSRSSRKENVDEQLQSKLQLLMQRSSCFSDDDKKLLLETLDKVIQKINIQKYKENHNPE